MIETCIEWCFYTQSRPWYSLLEPGVTFQAVGLSELSGDPSSFPRANKCSFRRSVNRIRQESTALSVSTGDPTSSIGKDKSVGGCTLRPQGGSKG